MGDEKHHKVNYKYRNNGTRASFEIEVKHLQTGLGMSAALTLEEGIAFYNIVLEQLRHAATNPDVLPQPLSILTAKKEPDDPPTGNVIAFRANKDDDSHTKG